MLHNRIAHVIEEAHYNCQGSDVRSIISLTDLAVQLDLTSEIIESCIKDSSILALLNNNQSNPTKIISIRRREEVTTNEMHAQRSLEVEAVLLGTSCPRLIETLINEHKWDSVNITKEFSHEDNNDIP